MKTQPVSVLYKASLYLVALLLSGLYSFGQTDITIGTANGASNNNGYPCPLQDYYEGSRGQFLYLASEMTAAGMQPGYINAVKFTVNGLNGTGIIEDYTIKIAGTSVATLNAATWEPSGSTVFGPVNYQPVTGVNSFNLQPTFFWNGTDNIIVEICNGGADYTANPAVQWTTGLSFNGSHQYRADNMGNLCATNNTSNSGTMTTRPVIIFNYTPAAACTGTPVAGTATSSQTNICMGGTFNLSLTGATAATGLTYQWQSSADNINWINIAGATTPFLPNRTQTVTTYYRCVVTCTGSGASASSSAAQVTSPALIRGVFTINKNAPAGNGNFVSFNAAYDYIKCGIDSAVVFNVVAGSGTYDEQLIITPVGGASATNTITFNGNNQTITYLSTNANEAAVIKLNGADYFTFNDLKIVPKGTTSAQRGIGVHLINDADFNTINNCTITLQATNSTSSYAGIALSASHSDPAGRGAANCDDNTFSNNTITGGYYGITLVGSSSVANQRNKITGNTITESYYRGVYVHGAFNTLIKNNNFSRPTRNGVTTYAAIHLQDLSTKVSIDGNRISNPFGGNTTSTSSFYGIYLDNVEALSGLENEVVNNLVYNLNGAANRYGIYNNGASNVRFYHNTISIDGTSSSTNNTYKLAGYVQMNDAAGIEFVNNIITLTATSTIPQYGLYFGNAYPAGDVVSDKNDIFINPIGANKFIGYYTKNQPTLSDWKMASQQDAASFSVNPFYQDIATGNYSATNASLNNRGNVVNTPVDINNIARNISAPDLGAYEFTPPPCVTPPTGGSTQLSKQIVCAGAPVILSLAGNSMGDSQTYQWQSSATLNGTYTNLGPSSSYSDSTILASTTLYYRAALTCGTNTSYSTPALLTVNGALAPNTYTIDKNQPTGGLNYNSFNDAKQAMMCGIAGPIIFEVTAGRTPYEEQLVLDSIPGASAINTITFKGNGNTIHFSSNDASDKAVIKLRKADHITFDSLKIDATGNGSYGWGVQFFNHADSNVVTRCEILTKADATSDQYAGIIASTSETDAVNNSANSFSVSNIFSRNRISGGFYGIVVMGYFNAGTSNYQIVGNEVKDFYSRGIYSSYTGNTLIADNIVSRPTRQNADWSVYGISMTSRHNNARVLRNVVSNGAPQPTSSTYYAISFDNCNADDGKADTIANNVIYNMNVNGNRRGISISYSTNIIALHNSISVDAPGSTQTWNTTAGCYIISGTNTKFINNNITVTSTGAEPKYAIYLSGDADIQNNNYYVKGDDADNYVGYFNGARSTLTEWKANTQKDSASTDFDPIYADLQNGNLMPVFFKLDNTGIPQGITSDILGKSRSSTTPDVGAYEISLPLCQTPINAGKAVVSPNTGICMGTHITLDLIENTTAGRLTYQWQASYSASGPWIYISDTAYIPGLKTELGANNYFRCQLVCSGTDTAWSEVAFVNMNQPLIKGVYTINPTGTGTRNFTSFQAAVTAMECGIAGEVIFDVVPGTYTEQIRMHRIPGASDTSRVTFRSQNGNPASATLTYAGTAANNYVLMLDSASYITYRNITITATTAASGRAVVFSGNAVKDSLVNNHINVPAVTADNTDAVGVFADEFKGGNIAIVGNTLRNGSSGIHFSGTSVNDEVHGLVVDSNNIAGVFSSGIYLHYVTRPVVSKNIVDIKDPLAGTAYGIVLNSGDTAYKVINNTLTISNTSASIWGIALQDCRGSAAATGLVEANKVNALNGNTGMIWALANNTSSYNTTVNNIISVKTTGAVAYGLFSNQGNNINYYNNSVYNASTSTGPNVAGYFSHTSPADGNVRMRNNIFTNEGGGVAAEIVLSDYINSDYNTYYTTGNTLISRSGTGDDYDSLSHWIAASDLDISSIVYKPAFASIATLEPDLANPDVWAIHGRGVQIAGNDHDINRRSRPVSLTAGVPDMGAYEFLPTAQPTVLQAIPATPAPGITQQFLYGSDTVAKITWDPNTAVPSTIVLKRYSGVVPPNLTAGTPFMYFYTDVDVTGGSNYKFNIEQFYVDSWLGYMDREKNVRLGRTDAADTWIVNDSSTVNEAKNILADTALQYLDKFTGLKGKLIFDNEGPAGADTSNLGTRFWVAYGHDRSFITDNDQNLALHLVAGQTPAHVVVKVNGTAWGKDYLVPANSSLTTDFIPKAGLSDARLSGEGLYPFGISIESDAPITAYAHQYSSSTAGATLLMPVGTYGYEYRPMTARQYADANAFSWFYIVADNDSSVVEITPSQATAGGRTAGVPFQVTLNRGEVYQVLGASMNEDEGYDLSGSIVRAVQNAAGKCYPVAVFSGNSFSSFGCGGSGGFVGSEGDNIVQQNLPVQSWGKTFLTAPSSGMADPVRLMNNIYRVLVKDPATMVKRNNVQIPLNTLINNTYYEFESKVGESIEADKPVTVAQYFTNDGSCNNAPGGDVDMVYLTPVEQAVKKATFYRNADAGIDYNFIALVIHKQGLNSLLIDGSNTFSYTFNHQNKADYVVVVKRWDAADALSTVKSDSAFTAITYGFGYDVSYVYNVAMQIRNLNIQPAFANTNNQTGNKNAYTCVKTPFRLTALLPMAPATLTWKLSEVSNLTPSTDIVSNNPVPEDTLVIDGQTYYQYQIATEYAFSAPGDYLIPVKVTDPAIESCDNSITTYLKVKVTPAPHVDFAISYNGCISDVAVLNGTATTENNALISKWKWSFGDGTSADTRNVTKQYDAAGEYYDTLQVITRDGCVGDTVKKIVVNEPTAALLITDTLTICANTDASFTVLNPDPAATYNWYNSVTGGALLASGTTLEIKDAVSPAVYYVETTKGGCAGMIRTPATLLVMPQLAAPVLRVDSIGVDQIRFTWNEIAGATGYLVSTDNGTTWLTPSAGADGLEHLVTGLKPQQSVTLLVKATGCEDKVSQAVTGKTLPDGIYIPTGFTPNGDGKNDTWLVYGAVVREIHFMVFNQWGEKIFESNNQQLGWDGTYQGKAQPSGVYIYICKLRLADGTSIERKGTLNLLR
ncbi:Ig-like domain-containing protein [Chitinophaga rhizophila]|uniref:Gliding motility-associated C-terminal domain-containing protein n=1 Tax=Chitinophaga rhizophila TaxID=2866212 RepID=A0ABS7GAN7_9BACT|nr:gliding motility-associated C-terminal domain-containing protein [Chitinophaga rhizophila]MBW8683792.1 gliding motility-associated C-terminal domain-containing protein [Chitinophaga rhizophila]